LAVAGLGLSALPTASVTFELGQKRLAIMRTKGWPLRRTMPVVHHQQKYLSKALMALLSELKSHVSATKVGRRQYR
jgi:DNA-binding transcriptional LysR family regulator